MASVRIPSLLSFMATGSPGGEVEGINNIQQAYEQKYGPGDYTPYVPVTYWSFRLMIGFGGLAMLVALAALWATRRGRAPTSRWLWLASIASIGMPLAANSFGWIFTEMGRQPWTVFGVFKTAQSVSPSVGAASVATSLIVLTLLYGVLAVVEVGLFIRYARAGAPEIEPETDDADRPLAFAY
jgi:cytochrome d ubiquinol oxidase subunit I